MVWFLGECLRSAAFYVDPPNDPTDDPKKYERKNIPGDCPRSAAFGIQPPNNPTDHPKKYEKLNIPGDCLRSVAFAIQPPNDPTDDPEKYGKTFEKAPSILPCSLESVSRREFFVHPGVIFVFFDIFCQFWGPGSHLGAMPPKRRQKGTKSKQK